MGDLLPNLLRAGVVTLEISAGAWVVSAAMGLLFALVRELGHPIVRIPLTALTTTLRSVPQLIVLYLLYFGPGALGLSLPPLLGAIIGLGAVEGAFTAEYFHAGFGTVPSTQRDAGRSLGLSMLNVMRLVVIPQAIPFAVPPLVNSFVGLLKTATLASAVGVPEILYRTRDDITRIGLIVPVVTLTMAIYVVVTLPLTRLASILEWRVRGGRVEALT